MTDSGLAVLTAMLDGLDHTIKTLRRATGLCSKKVRGAVVGSFLGGLVEETTPDRIGLNLNPTPRWRITDAGRDAVAELG